MRYDSLDGTWHLYGYPERESPIREPEDLRAHVDECIPGIVPGNVELDLVRAGILPDPFLANNVHALRPFELYEWWYERTFRLSESMQRASGSIQLVFEGIDCMADIWLNGQQIGHTANMLIAHRFEVRHLLRKQDANHLVVRLKSPILEALSRPYDPSLATWGFGEGRLWVRKAAHSYGWDIMPRALSAGLWRSVSLQAHEAHEIVDLVFHTQRLDAGRATVELYFEVETAPERLLDLSLRLTGRCRGATFDVRRPVRFKAGTITFDIADPILWWPCGYGEPDRYDVHVALMAGDEVLARRDTTLGIRTIELVRTDTTSAEHPGEFLFKVNKVPILCKGTNWVPADVFHSRDAERIPDILALAVDVGCNIIRCWGGGVYEDAAFYEFCDAHGILVWQDFALACARYPQDPLFLETIREEALTVVRKLRSHPCIALWCGDNECDMLYDDPSQNRITREILPQAVFQADPHRPYLPSSPYIAPASNGQQALLPEQHLWGPRDYYKSEFYTQHTAHFVSEIGYHGCPNLSAIKRFIDAGELWPWQGNVQWITHCTAPAGLDDDRRYRVQLMVDQIQELFGIRPDDLETFILASQISQAEAKKYFIESTRLAKWRRTGVIWWNLMDGWPQFSDAVVDYYFGKKLAYHYIKRVQQPLCLIMTEPSGWHVRLIAGNDSRTDFRGGFRVWDADTGETVLAGAYLSAAGTTTELGALKVSRGDQCLYLIEWTVEGEGADAIQGNHYLLGTPPFSLFRYSHWLSQIASLSPAFAADQVGK
ncbi:MAG: glycoside hydrolase family 2 [Anaerolineae bacterium]|nr:glycoside hydrolase family 2 [Anaerolineae bacterium]